MTLLLSIIIPVKDDLEIFNLINQLKQQSSRHFEVIIVTNGSSPSFKNRIKHSILGIGNFHLISLSQGNIPLARNNGVAKSSGEFLLFLDSDCVLSPLYISSVVKYLKKTDQDLIVRGKVRFISRKGWFSEFNCIMRNRSYDRHKHCYMPNLLVSAFVFRKVGGFSLSTKYGEDTEWGRRAKLLGFGLKNRSLPATVSHIDDLKARKTVRTWFYYGVGRAFRARQDLLSGLSTKRNYVKSLFSGSQLIDKGDRVGYILFVCFHYIVRSTGVLYGTFLLKHEPHAARKSSHLL